MKQNPYIPPKMADGAPTVKRSRRPHVIASIVVLIAFAILSLFVYWYTDAKIEGGEIWFHIPGESVSSSPSGDPIIAYDRMLYASIGGVVALSALLLGLTLVVVNGLLFFLRR